MTKITITGPQFERPADAPTVAAPPADLAAWRALATLDEIALKEMGLLKWCDAEEEGWPFRGVLMLFPGEWFLHIPEAFYVVTIDMRWVRFHRDVMSDDIRFGCLAYGVLAVPAAKEGSAP